MLSISKKTFFIFISLYILATIYMATTTPISPHEAKLFFQTDGGIVSLLMRYSYSINHSFLSMRIPFLLLAYVSVFLYYKVAKEYFQDQGMAYFSTVVFAFLPGVLTASVLANISILVIPLVLLFLIFYKQKNYIFISLIMVILFFIHQASIIFFISIFIYSLIQRDKKLLILTSSFLIAFIYLAKGISIGGRPSGHFADIFGLYAGVFSPLLFLYFFYSNYRILLREKKSLIWYISFIALVVSLILSIRQKIYITDFAPYVVISIVSMIHVFQNSLQVRLPMFQDKYKLAYYTVMATFVLSSLVIIFHKAIFYMIDNPKEHFAYKLYYPYNKSQELKKQNLTCIENLQSRYRYQFRFYGISECDFKSKSDVSKIHN